jgi:DnaJ domain
MKVSIIASAMSPYDLDILDEPRALSKEAIDNMLGVVYPDLDYAYYLAKFDEAQHILRSKGPSPSGSRTPTTGEAFYEGDCVTVSDRVLAAASNYAKLGLDPMRASSITEADVKKAYRKLSLKVHPDRCPEDIDKAGKAFQGIEILTLDLGAAYAALLKGYEGKQSA